MKPKPFIPRALSLERGTPHYRPDAMEIGHNLIVLLNGDVMTDVIEYNCDAGYIRRHKRDSDGKPMLNDRRDTILTEVLRGTVIVNVKPGPEPV